MFNKILIANRGEIACRIIAAAKALNITTVAIYSAVDKHAKHVQQADEAYFVGPSPVNESYLNQQRIIDIAVQAKADAIHPGYGLLAENADFAAACTQAGIKFIGPSADTIAQMGDKAAAKQLAKDIGVPIIDSLIVPQDITEEWLAPFKNNDDKWLIKATAGGGGKGMRLIDKHADIISQIELAKKEAQTYFGHDELIIEKFVKPARHIEVQIVADQQGHVIHLFDRDCSLQRRYQKVIEEAPAPNIPQNVRDAMASCAIQLAQAVNYEGAGTVEFLLDESNQFYFLEMNTRVQVEHCVTEMVTHEDIVQMQCRIAVGEAINKVQTDYTCDGCAIEVRLCAEQPQQNFLASVGRIKHMHWPQFTHCRIDSGYEKGHCLSPYYDSMMAKMIVWGATRQEAILRLQRALNLFYVEGLETNRTWLSQIIHLPEFAKKPLSTHFLEDFSCTTKTTLPDDLLLGLWSIYKTLKAKSGDVDQSWQTRDVNKAIVYDEQGKSQTVIVNVVDSLQFDIVGAQKVFIVEVLRVDDHHLQFKWQDHLYDIYLFANDDTVEIRHQDHVVTFNLYPPRKVSDQQTSGHLLAPLPGSVVKVFVNEGDIVKQGDRLIVLEAMKMEHPLLAPYDGVVKSIAVQSGDRVSLGQQLAMVE